MRLIMGLGRLGTLSTSTAEVPQHSASNLLLRDNSSNLLLHSGFSALLLGHS